MKIEGNTIIFKSMPNFWHKEKNGLKCCTVRSINLLSEWKELVEFVQDFNVITDKRIQIINAETEESFIRRLTDISRFENHLVFSWEHA